jgi:hypothetical protein
MNNRKSYFEPPYAWFTDIDVHEYFLPKISWKPLFKIWNVFTVFFKVKQWCAWVFILELLCNCLKMCPCHHNMARPLVVDGEMASSYGGELWIHWISNHGQTARGGPQAWWLGVGLTTLHRKKISLFQTKTQESWTWTDPFDKWTERQNMDTRFGMCNVRTLYRVGYLVSFEITIQIWVRFSGSAGGQMGGWWHRTNRRI